MKLKSLIFLGAILMAHTANADAGFAEIQNANTIVNVMPYPVPMSDLQCAQNYQEFRSSQRLRNAFGEAYNPFVNWNGNWGVNVHPIKNDPQHNMLLDVGMGHVSGYNDIPMDIRACVETIGGKITAFLMLGKRKLKFDDARMNTITLSQGDGGYSITLTRQDPNQLANGYPVYRSYSSIGAIQ